MRTVFVVTIALILASWPVKAFSRDGWLNYYAHTQHNLSAAALVMIKNVWNDLDDKDKDILEDTAAIVIRKQFANAKAEDERWIATTQAKGMQFTSFWSPLSLFLPRAFRFPG